MPCLALFGGDPLIVTPSPILTLAIVLVVGMGFGRLAKMVGLPSITGQIVGGILMAEDVLHVFGHEAVASLVPVTDFALGLIGVAVGSHLQVRRLRNAHKRLAILLCFECTVTPVLVLGALLLLGRQASGGALDADGLWLIAPLLAACAISTAPATIVALVKETRSKGVFVKTLVAAVALNNMACITLFELAHEAVRAQLGAGDHSSVLGILIAPLEQLGLSLLLGGSMALALVLATRRVVSRDRLATYSMITILLCSGLADWFGVSPLLSCLLLGMTLANVTPDREEIGHRVFANFELAVYAAFFTLAGMHLDFDVLKPALLLSLMVVVTRFCGKYLAAQTAMNLARATRKIRQYLGLGLIPQAGVAIGLIIIVLEDELFSSTPEMRTIQGLFVAVGLSSVLINEVIGPITTRHALIKSGDAGKDRARLIDFLHEENITIGLAADSKEDAIAKLVDLLIQTHDLQVDRSAFLDSVLEREREFSTCLGSGLAMPHGVLPSGDAIVGVMGISREGMAFETPDGRPVHCMILLATPAAARNRHLEVLAAFARAIGRDPDVQQELYHAESPAHAYDLLHAEESEGFNYFLDGGVR